MVPVKKLFAGHLFVNSFYMMLSTGVMSVLGFVFWVIAARIYTPEQVGLASAAIAGVSLIASMGLFGFNFAFVRYLPRASNRKEHIDTGISLVVILAILGSIVYLVSVFWFSPILNTISNHTLLFAVFTILAVAATLNTLTDSIFIALRSAKYNFIAYVSLGLSRLIFPFILVPLGAVGLILSQTIAMIFAVFLSFFFMFRYFNYTYSPRINRQVITEVINFSFISYITAFVGGLSSLLLSPMIVRSLGPAEAAYYYVAMMIASVLFVIPTAVANSLLAEGSHDETNISNDIKKSIGLIASILVPCVVFVILTGRYMLLFFGTEYAQNAYHLLCLLAISAIFIAINSIFGSYFRVKHNLHPFLVVNIFGTALTLIMSAILIHNGLVYLGASWLAGQILMSICYAGYFLMHRK